MKKILFFLTTALFMTLLAGAQIKKGSVLLGGSLGTDHDWYKDTNNTTGRQNWLQFSPAIGLATKDNAIWGLTISYGRTGRKYQDITISQKDRSYGGGIFYRRYLPVGKGFNLFGQAEARYHQSLNHISSPEGRGTKAENKVAILGIFPGIAYVVGKNFHLEVGIGDLANLNFSQQKYSIYDTGTGMENSSTSNSVSFTTSASSANALSVGFRFVLGK